MKNPVSTGIAFIGILCTILSSSVAVQVKIPICREDIRSYGEVPSGLKADLEAEAFLNKQFGFFGFSISSF